MISILLFAFALLRSTTPCSAYREGAPLNEQMPWYHSSDAVHAALQDLSSACPSASFEISTRSALNPAVGGEVQLDVLHVTAKSPATDAKPRAKALLVFGEHARELITVETALDFANTLCGSGPSGTRAAEVLERVEFTIVPNANPEGRKLVEQGAYCKRTNEDGVDLNRNWGSDHREAKHAVDGDEMNPGPEGFSEPETKILKGLVDEVNPDLFLSVHSGAYLLGTPFGYTRGKEPEHEKDMLDVLAPISREYCAGECPYGDLYELINYKNGGCDIDYASEEAHVPYAFTFEIYIGSSGREIYKAEAEERSSGGMAAVQQAERDVGDGEESSLSLTQLAARRSARAAALLREQRQGQGRARLRRAHLELERQRLQAAMPEPDQEPKSCLDQFSPQSEGETRDVVRKWSSAFLDLASAVAQKQSAAKAKPAKPEISLTGDAAATVDPYALNVDGASKSDPYGLRAFEQQLRSDE